MRRESGAMGRAEALLKTWRLNQDDSSLVSPLRAPAEPKPLQRVSEPVSRKGAEGEVCSATNLA